VVVSLQGAWSLRFLEGRCESLRVRPLVTGEANKVIHAWRPTDIEPCVLVVGIGGGEVQEYDGSTQPHFKLNLIPH
jgi:hypothetical protein